MEPWQVLSIVREAALKLNIKLDKPGLGRSLVGQCEIAGVGKGQLIVLWKNSTEAEINFYYHLRQDQKHLLESLPKRLTQMNNRAEFFRHGQRWMEFGIPMQYKNQIVVRALIDGVGEDAASRERCQVLLTVLLHLIRTYWPLKNKVII